MLTLTRLAVFALFASPSCDIVWWPVLMLSHGNVCWLAAALHNMVMTRVMLQERAATALSICSFPMAGTLGVAKGPNIPPGIVPVMGGAPGPRTARGPRP